MKTIKIYIIVFISIFVWSLSFQNNFFVYATAWSSATATSSALTNPQSTQNPAQQTQKKWIFEAMEKFLNMVYMIMWPLIVLAWNAIDNKFVYWEVFHLDIHLWKLWNVMKSFANYTLWFLFLFSIVMFFFSVKWWGEKYNPKKLIPKLLLWAVMIQSSWFLVWALVDISIVLTYWFWAMPFRLAMFKEIQFENVHTYMNLSKVWKTADWPVVFNFYWTWWTFYLSCKVKEKNLLWWNERNKFVEQAQKELWSDWNLDKSKCVYSDVKTGWKKLIPLSFAWKPIADILKDTSQLEDYPKPWQWVSMFDSFIKEKWMTGPLSALFLNIMNFSNMSEFWAGWTNWEKNFDFSYMWVIFWMKIIVAFVIIVPLLALVVVLIVRLVYMRMIIVFSPFLAITWIFWLKLWDKASKMTMSAVLSLIFLPAIVTFAIWLSLVFLSALWKNIWNDPNLWPNNPSNLEKAIWFKTDTVKCNWSDNCTQIILPTWNKITFILPKWWWLSSDMFDLFWWIIINLIWVWIVWILIFSALKTSSLTSNIVGYVEWMAKWFLKATPILPWVSMWSLKQFSNQVQSLPSTIQSKQYQESWIQSMFDRMRSWLSWETASISQRIWQDAQRGTRYTPWWWWGGSGWGGWWPSWTLPPTSPWGGWVWSTWTWWNTQIEATNIWNILKNWELPQWHDINKFKQEILQAINDWGIWTFSSLEQAFWSPQVVEYFKLHNDIDILDKSNFWNFSNKGSPQQQEDFWKQFIARASSSLESQVSPISTNSSWIKIWKHWNYVYWFFWEKWKPWSYAKLYKWFTPWSWSKSDLESFASTLNELKVEQSDLQKFGINISQPIQIQWWTAKLKYEWWVYKVE